ncbi:phage holin family protein [Gordonia rhizosphera]|uniref:Phage holin family protein n=1 Tax=Gordonia rhizosphera NBRC 16068 TaxID=1108045 RepID=K6W5Q1_9ACTN|nr:phage holin family protein [Gordonia rhizosphera]GAB89031.1 hypothetical protein GORHZ_048_00080 [Gordonia rhizosphera NBRC 16068]
MSRNEPGQPAQTTGTVPSIPLSDPNLGRNGEPSIGNLVKDATASVSTLFRSEVALAKAELVGEAKKAGAGTGLLIAAGVMALYSSFFFFFFLAELLDIWMPRWLAFLIVFLLLVLVTIVMAIVGYVFFRRIRGPEKTIASVKEVQAVLPGSHSTSASTASPAGSSPTPSSRASSPAPASSSDHPDIPRAHDPRRG